jgi:RNA polymerase sigma-70 factor (ECF subfamily)
VTLAEEQRFRRLYEQSYEALLAYALRRVPDRSEAHDVVADTFLVLWRRLRDAPPDEEIPLWLYGIARRVLANKVRGGVRRERLSARLSQLAANAPTKDEIVDLRIHAESVITALGLLGDSDREILMLAAWENLSTAEIAKVIGCTENAAAIRLHRARRRLTDVHAKEASSSGHKNVKWLQLRRPRDERREP